MNFPFHFSINKLVIAVLLLNISRCFLFFAVKDSHLSPSKLKRTVSLVLLQKELRLVAGEVGAVV